MSEVPIPEGPAEIEAVASPEEAERPEGEAFKHVRLEAKAKSVVLDKETIEYI